MNNCFRIIFKGECEKLEENLAKHDKLTNIAKLSNHAKKSCQHNHCADYDYNAELLYF